MPKLATRLYKLARTVNDVEWFITGNPIKILKHFGAKKVIGHSRRFWSNVIFHGKFKW